VIAGDYQLQSVRVEKFKSGKKEGQQRPVTLALHRVGKDFLCRSHGGFGSGRLLIPLPVAETLRAAQVNDLRDVLRGSSPADKPAYASLTAMRRSTR
jgi:hypothetical protein